MGNGFIQSFLFTPLYHRPLRLEFFDETLESIRFFNPANQRSSDQLEDVIIVPAHEVLITTSSRQRASSELKAALSRESESREDLELWLERVSSSGHFPGIEQLLPLYYEELETLFHYLPASTLIVLSDPSGIKKEVEERHDKAHSDRTLARQHARWNIQP